ncbi:MAG: response regulator [Chitinispirillaceae bacterium]
MPEILIIDDEEAAVFGFSRYFSKQGYSVQSAGTIEEGRRHIQSSSFDAVVLDIRLPDGNALEFIPEIKAFNQKTTVVVVSGLADNDTAQTAQEMGADDFLVKPLKMAALCEALKNAFESSSLAI